MYCIERIDVDTCLYCEESVSKYFYYTKQHKFVGVVPLTTYHTAKSGDIYCLECWNRMG